MGCSCGRLGYGGCKNGREAKGAGGAEVCHVRVAIEATIVECNDSRSKPSSKLEFLECAVSSTDEEDRNMAG